MTNEDKPARQYNSELVERNTRLFNSMNGIREQVRSSKEALSIAEKGEKRYSYFVSFVYDTRDGEVVSCGADLPTDFIEDFKKGLIGRAWIEAERKQKQLRIRKLIGYDRILQLVKLKGKEEYFVNGLLDTKVPNVNKTTRYASNTLLETILQYNHLQRKKRKQGVNN